MGLEEGEQDRSYMIGCRSKNISSLFCGHLLSCMVFVEHLGTAGSFEAFSEKPAAWKCCMRAYMHACRWYDFLSEV